MDEAVKSRLAEIHSGDRSVQGQAYEFLLAATEQPVDWAYDAWDELLKTLTHKDNRLRSIGSQLLCNLAKSDPEARIVRVFDAPLEVTRDDRFVTARHCLLSLWKIGLAGDSQKRRLIDGLEDRFAECIAEKNCTLIRFDSIQGLRNLYDQTKDESIRKRALELIETEADPKYRSKYAGVWKM